MRRQKIGLQWRRQYIDEILFGCRMTAVEKLVGIAIAYSINRKTRATFESYSTLAKRLHLKMKVVAAAAESLKAKGRLKIESRYGKPHLYPVTKGDAPHRSTSGGKVFYANRGKAVEEILKCRLSPAARITYAAIAALADPDTGNCSEGQRYIGKLIGLSPSTMYRTTSELAFNRVMGFRFIKGSESVLWIGHAANAQKANPGHDRGHDPGQRPGQHPGHGQRASAATSKAYEATPRTSVSPGPCSTYGTAPFAFGERAA
jgi:hypothetical protein